MYACVHGNQLHLKLVKADAAAVNVAPAGAAPKRKRNVGGAENAPENVGTVINTTRAPVFNMGAQGASAPVAGHGATTAPVRAVRAKKSAPRPRKVIPNKRISGSATSTPTEVGYLFIC